VRAWNIHSFTLRYISTYIDSDRADELYSDTHDQVCGMIRRPFKVIHLVETYDAGVITGQHNGVGSIPCAGMVHFSGTHGMGKED